MTREDYIKITGILRGNETRIRLVRLCNQILTGAVFAAYPLFLCYLIYARNPYFWYALVIPAISFVAVSIFRKRYNAPRPYERFGMPAVLKKESSGKSFPSRHVFSAFVIATIIFFVFPRIGILFGVFGILLAFIRVLGGVHTPVEVAVGAVAGVLCGLFAMISIH